MLPNLTVALKVRGYSDADVQKILGLNWIRVLKAHGL
jgi:microsomal dipeptidase-like Zn-dependent dipeptidase